jgi:hypothetical protein
MRPQLREDRFDNRWRRFHQDIAVLAGDGIPLESQLGGQRRCLRRKDFVLRKCCS